MLPLAVLLLSAAVSAAPAAPMRLTLKNGTVFLLKEPPRISSGRFVFTTAEGKVYSLAETEVASIGNPPAPTAGPRKYNPQDSRALGAIARQQRARRGKAAEVAPAPATTPRRAARKPNRSQPTRTPGAVAPAGGSREP